MHHVMLSYEGRIEVRCRGPCHTATVWIAPRPSERSVHATAYAAAWLVRTGKNAIGRIVCWSYIKLDARELSLNLVQASMNWQTKRAAPACIRYRAAQIACFCHVETGARHICAYEGCADMKLLPNTISLRNLIIRIIHVAPYDREYTDR